MSGPDEELLSFIASSFRSVWALELLLLLKTQPRVWPRAELVTALRASDLVVSHALDGLVAAGLASIDGDGARYAPANAQMSGCVDRVEELYRSRPNSVRRTIIAAGSSSATALADAFKLRND